MSEPLVISGGGTTVRVDPERGGEVIGIEHRLAGNVLYWSPGFGKRLIERHFEASHAEWLRDYNGGWQVLLPNAGPKGIWNGVDVGFHGSLAREPWSVQDHGPARITLECQSWTGITEVRVLEVDASGAVIVTEEVSHDASDALRWVHHPVFEVTKSALIATGDEATDIGVEAFLERGEPGEQFFATAAANKVRLLPGTQPGLELELTWSRAVWPYFWIWGGTDHGHQYLGIEPANLPAPSARTPAQRGKGLEPSVTGSVVLRMRMLDEPRVPSSR